MVRLHKKNSTILAFLSESKEAKNIFWTGPGSGLLGALPHSQESWLPGYKVNITSMLVHSFSQNTKFGENGFYVIITASKMHVALWIFSMAGFI